jgi:capsid protein
LGRRGFFIPAYEAEIGLPNVLHLTESERPGQHRGIPVITPVVELALTQDRYIKADANTANIQALFTVVITSENQEVATRGNDNKGNVRGNLRRNDRGNEKMEASPVG